MSAMMLTFTISRSGIVEINHHNSILRGTIAVKVHRKAVQDPVQSQKSKNNPATQAPYLFVLCTVTLGCNFVLFSGICWPTVLRNENEKNDERQKSKIPYTQRPTHTYPQHL